jgi:hypothetical protein
MPVYLASSEVACRSVLVDDSFMRYDATSLGNWIFMFPRNVLSSFWKVTISINNGPFWQWRRGKYVPQNVGIRLLSGEPSRPRRTVSLLYFNFVFATKYTFCYAHKNSIQNSTHLSTKLEQVGHKERLQKFWKNLSCNMLLPTLNCFSTQSPCALFVSWEQLWRTSVEKDSSQAFQPFLQNIFFISWSLLSSGRPKISWGRETSDNHVVQGRDCMEGVQKFPTSTVRETSLNGRRCAMRIVVQQTPLVSTPCRRLWTARRSFFSVSQYDSAGISRNWCLRGPRKLYPWFSAPSACLKFSDRGTQYVANVRIAA